jgi:hypothetical protein
LQQQNVKTKAATKYAVKVLSDFMLEKNYDGEIDTMDIVVLNGIMCILREVTFIENSSRKFAGNLA